MPGEPLDRVVQLRLSASQHNALRLAAAESDETISGAARSILVAALVQQYPELLPHLVDDDLERRMAAEDARDEGLS